MTVAVVALAAGRAMAQGMPRCLVIDPQLVGDATALRLEPLGGDRYRADAETVFIWHGGVCNDCIGAGRGYPELLTVFTDVVRQSGPDGASFKGTNFSLNAAGDVEIRLDGGVALKGHAFPAKAFPGSRYCDGFGA